ncbi:hypothetical protein N7471_005660 [Penicillium samsonianum]|uniref:uncharacterized protein n=1 Tax=Penicillium samsonianum TaxID=1882272 RepID=UPI0025494930|nr:uncharacterized protein N7471_005660 [Penicillium samsonianum]KAJ6139174.1 hypothetical protein N7471_005660 [Penicillium samsonianum]
MHVLNDLGKLSRGNHVPPSVVGLRVVNLCDSRVKLKVTLDVGSPSYNVFLLHGLREHSGRSTGYITSSALISPWNDTVAALASHLQTNLVIHIRAGRAPKAQPEGTAAILQSIDHTYPAIAKLKKTHQQRDNSGRYIISPTELSQILFISLSRLDECCLLAGDKTIKISCHIDDAI